MIWLVGGSWMVYAPFIVSYVTVRDNPTYWTATGHMGALCMSILLFLTLIAYIHKRKNGASMTSTLHRSKYPHFLNPFKWGFWKVFGNWGAIFTLLLTFVQMLSFTAPPETYPGEYLEVAYSIAFLDFDIAFDVDNLTGFVF